MTEPDDRRQDRRPDEPARGRRDDQRPRSSDGAGRSRDVGRGGAPRSGASRSGAGDRDAGRGGPRAGAPRSGGSSRAGAARSDRPGTSSRDSGPSADRRSSAGGRPTSGRGRPASGADGRPSAGGRPSGSSGGRPSSGSSGRPSSAGGRPSSGGRSGAPGDRSSSSRYPSRDDAGRGRSGSSERGGRPSTGPRGNDRRDAPRPDRGAARGTSEPREHFPETPRLEIPIWARNADLDPSVRSALRSLSSRAAEEVSGHLAAAAEYLDDDPTAALAHARVARSHAARVAVVREAVGIAAYRAGEWNEALAELRAAHRMSGEPYLVPLLMDTERALGRPQAALKLAESLRGKRLDADTRVELAVVTAGVRRDLGSPESALAVLEREDLARRREPALSVRLWYAYADALEAVGRREDAARWFGEAAGSDRDGVTDAADRAAALL